MTPQPPLTESVRTAHWRPVSTAPRDGSAFLMAYRARDGHRVTAARFRRAVGVDIWDLGGGGNASIDSKDLLGWMPFPSPPGEWEHYLG